MTEQDSLSTKSDTAVDDATPEDIVSQNHAVSNAVTANMPSPSMASTRDWILYLPPELRLIIYSYVLQLPLDVPYYSSSGPQVEAFTGILRTSRLIRRESMEFFFKQNTFSFGPLMKRLPASPSQRLDDMIQNLTLDVLPGNITIAGRQIKSMSRRFGDPARIRDTFRFNIWLLDPVRLRNRHPPAFLILRYLRRFTNFRVVEVVLRINRPRNRLTPRRTSAHFDRIEFCLQNALGPATRRIDDAMNPRVSFFPHQLLNPHART